MDDMEIEETVSIDWLGNKQGTGMYRCTKDGVSGFGATKQAAYVNWKSKTREKPPKSEEPSVIILPDDI